MIDRPIVGYLTLWNFCFRVGSCAPAPDVPVSIQLLNWVVGTDGNFQCPVGVIEMIFFYNTQIFRNNIRFKDGPIM